MKYSQGLWRKSKRGWVIRTDTERICHVFHDRCSDGSMDEVAIGNLSLLLGAPYMYQALRAYMDWAEGSMPLMNTERKLPPYVSLTQAKALMSQAIQIVEDAARSFKGGNE